MAFPTVVAISQFLRAIRECFLPPKDDRDMLVSLFLHCAEAVIRFFMKGLGFFHEIVRLSIAAQLCTESFSWTQILSRSGKEERKEKHIPQILQDTPQSFEGI
jgi:hypothetical protein